MSDGETFSNAGYSYLDGSVGLSFNSQIGQTEDDNLFLGVAYHHFNKSAKVSFYGNKIEMLPKIVFSAGVRMGVTDYSFVTFQGDYSKQGGSTETIGGMLYSYTPGGLRATIDGPRWSYGLSFDPVKSSIYPGPVFLEIELEVSAGTLGIGGLKSDYSSYATSEMTVHAGVGRQIVTLTIDDVASVATVMFRKADESATPTSATIFNIRTFAGGVIGSNSQSTVLRQDLTVLSKADLKRAAAMPAAPHDKSVGISVVPSHELGRRLKYPAEFVPPFKIYRRPLSSFTMEIDDAPILRFLYRNSSPKRHLEFGTWQGFGTTLCAESCDAEIWTLNLPEGERGEAGEVKYFTSIRGIPPAMAAQANSHSDGNLQSDSGEMIGWMYRAAGFGARVHQLLVDSRDWDVSGFEPGFFDSVLIDGGHTPDVVKSDTEKALPLLRTGGIMMWHDFCPDAATVAALPACQGVVGAIAENLEKWRPFFKDVFWIQPSFLLLGIKA